MTTAVFLSNATVNITQGATTVDVSNQCTSVSLQIGFDSLETTAMGDTGRRYTKGMSQVEVTLEMWLSYGGSGTSSEVETILASCVGQGNTTLVISPSGQTESASNPEYTISNAMLANFTPINSNVGELATVTAVFVGGTWARDITFP